MPSPLRQSEEIFDNILVIMPLPVQIEENQPAKTKNSEGKKKRTKKQEQK
jgi:hypothetical protein